MYEGSYRNIISYVLHFSQCFCLPGASARV